MSQRKHSNAKEIKPTQHWIKQGDIAKLGKLAELHQFSDAVEWVQQSYRLGKDAPWANRSLVEGILLKELLSAIEAGEANFFNQLRDIVTSLKKNEVASPIEHSLVELRRLSAMFLRDDPDHTLLENWPWNPTKLRRYVQEETGTEFSLVAIRKAAQRVGIPLVDGRGKRGPAKKKKS